MDKILFFDIDTFISIVQTHRAIWGKAGDGYFVKNERKTAWRSVLHPNLCTMKLKYATMIKPKKQVSARYKLQYFVYKGYFWSSIQNCRPYKQSSILK